MAKILVVDDDPDLLETFSEELESCGHYVIRASDGFEALEALRTQAVDLVLTDVQMPGMDGFDLFEASRQIGHQTPFVFLTAYSAVSAAEAHRRGAKSYLLKPTEFPFLIRRIEDILSYQRRSTQRNVDLIGRPLASGFNDDAHSNLKTSIQPSLQARIATTPQSRTKSTAKIAFVENLVEDQTLFKKAFSNQKWSKNAELQFFENGQVFLDYLETLAESSTYDSESHDIIMVDLYLPKLDGFEVIARTKGHPKFSRIPLIVLSCSSKEADMKRAYDLGADSYLVKPWMYEPWEHLAREVGSSWLPHLACNPD